jgi:carboxyl-terminal processing protease
VLVSFLGRPATRTFGAATAGIPTGVRSIRMVDGALLAVAGSVLEDRLGRSYDGPIEPDEPVRVLFPFSDEDPVLDAAVEWLTAQEACQAEREA